jgi:hypothetical protein
MAQSGRSQTIDVGIGASTSRAFVDQLISTPEISRCPLSDRPLKTFDGGELSLGSDAFDPHGNRSEYVDAISQSRVKVPPQCLAADCYIAR